LADRHGNKYGHFDKSLSYRLVISVLTGQLGCTVGLLCIALSGGDNIHLLNGGVVPSLVITLAWGSRYGIFSTVCGLIINPHYISAYHGWTGFIPAADLMLWLMFIGKNTGKAIGDYRYYGRLILAHIKYIALFMPIYLAACPFIIQQNTLILRHKLLSDLTFRTVLILLLKNAAFQTILLAVCNALLLLSFIRRIFQLEISKYSQYNLRIILGTLSYGLLMCFLVVVDRDITEQGKAGVQSLPALLHQNMTSFEAAAVICLFFGTGLALLSQRYQMEKEIAKERTVELERAVKELEAFTYMVSHDLKSPLRAIELYAKILTEEYSGRMQGEMMELTDKIGKISRNTTAMVTRLLQYAMTADRTVDKKQINLKELIESSYEKLISDVQDRRIELFLEPELPFIWADEILIRMVIENVLINAIKFTKTRERAVIRVQHALLSEEVIISFGDNGVGFDNRLAGKLFHVFERLHSSDEFEGSGIGLATVRKIILKHGGKVWIEGIKDKGTTVYFTLPVVP
jgi:signal transduction histidine kinase